MKDMLKAKLHMTLHANLFNSTVLYAMCYDPPPPESLVFDFVFISHTRTYSSHSGKEKTERARESRVEAKTERTGIWAPA